tara:strand:+ start:405 stop:545 length:141 start_codon:yes stop_codon:yes gene_type:complete
MYGRIKGRKLSQKKKLFITNRLNEFLVEEKDISNYFLRASTALKKK